MHKASGVWLPGSEGKKYTPKVSSALKTQVPQQAKKRFGVYQKACLQGKKKENTYTPKRPQGVRGGPLCAVLVYRFWPPTGMFSSFAFLAQMPRTEGVFSGGCHPSVGLNFGLKCLQLVLFHTNVHLSNVNFVLRDVSALLNLSWGS